jgi:hypothetical protein
MEITEQNPVSPLDPEVAVCAFGGALKALGEGKVGGYLVLFTDADSPDLEGDFFDSASQFGPHTKSLTFYDHGQDETLKRTVLDDQATLKATPEGIWFEAQLNIRDKYQKMLYQLAKAGKLGLSSGTATHLVERTPVKNTAGKTVFHIDTWPLGLDASLTPCPAECRTLVKPLKSMVGPSFLDISNQEDTVSGTGKSLNSLRFADHSESVRTAVKEFTDRVKDYSLTRLHQNRALSPDRAAEFSAIREELGLALKSLDEALLHTPVTHEDLIRELQRDVLALDPLFLDFP